MEAMKCVKERRSIRRFAPKDVPAETVVGLVEAARYAPSWKNSQTVRYIALTGDVKDRVAREGVMGFGWNTAIIQGAPVLMLLTTVDGVSGYEKSGEPATSKGSHWQSFDAGLSAEAFCLAAHDAGLVTVILGIYDDEAVRRLASVPEGQSVSALIALGWPADAPAAPARRDVSELLSWRA